MVETCSLTLYNINKTVVLTCRSINCCVVARKERSSHLLRGRSLQLRKE